MERILTIMLLGFIVVSCANNSTRYIANHEDDKENTKQEKAHHYPRLRVIDRH